MYEFLQDMFNNSYLFNKWSISKTFHLFLYEFHLHLPTRKDKHMQNIPVQALVNCPKAPQALTATYFPNTGRSFFYRIS